MAKFSFQIMEIRCNELHGQKSKELKQTDPAAERRRSHSNLYSIKSD